MRLAFKSGRKIALARLNLGEKFPLYENIRGYEILNSMAIRAETKGDEEMKVREDFRASSSDWNDSCVDAELAASISAHSWDAFEH